MDGIASLELLGVEYGVHAGYRRLVALQYC